jgi:hypothetical protein
MSVSDSKDSKLEKIKKEGTEDASSYYAQGDKGDAHDLKGEYAKPLPPVDSATEEFNLVRTLSYLAFGGAGLALIFILFFIRDLDKRVDHVGKEVVDLTPFKKEVGDNLTKLNTDVDKLRSRVEQYEKATMIMELKRAMATVQAVSESSAELKAKSTQVVASIQTLLDELESGAKAPAPTAGAPAAPAPDAKPADATVPAAPASEVKPAEGTAPAAPTSDAKPAEGTAPAGGAPAAVSAPAPAATPATPAVSAPATPPAAPVAKADANPAGAKKKKASKDDDDEEDD